MFIAFGSSAWLAATAGNVTARIDRAAAFFRRLAADLEGPAEIDQITLFRVFGAEGLRRNHRVVSFLCGHLDLAWSKATLDRLIEEARQAALISAHAASPWGHVLEAYRRHLWTVRTHAGPALSPRTVRLYLSSAAGLLSESGIRSLPDLRQEHLDHHFRRHRGQAANLRAFLRFAADAGVSGLSVPGRRRSKASTLERRLIGRLHDRLTALASESRQPRRLALAAAAIADLYQLPLSVVLALEIAALGLSAEGLVLRLKDGDQVLPETLADVLLESVGPRSAGPVFLGRNRVQALSEAAVRHHLVRRELHSPVAPSDR